MRKVMDCKTFDDLLPSHLLECDKFTNAKPQEANCNSRIYVRIYVFTLILGSYTKNTCPDLSPMLVTYNIIMFPKYKIIEAKTRC
jgi:hypothetical protein